MSTIYNPVVCPCPNCHGTGKEYHTQTPIKRGIKSYWGSNDCPVCHGQGSILEEGE